MPLYRAFELTIASDILLPELISLPENGNSIPDIHIVRSAITFPSMEQTAIHRRGVMARSGTGSDGSICLQWEGIASFRAVGGHTLYVDSYTEDFALLSLFTVSEALGCVLFQRGLLLLHASSVQVGQEAFCFMGEPGAGKSTTASAFVKQGAQLLSDDLTAIAFDKKNQPFVLPAYPQLKIWGNTVQGLGLDSARLVPVSEGINKFAMVPDMDFPSKPVPVAQIYFLHKARNRSALQAVQPTEAPVELVRHFPLATHLLTGKALQRHFMQSIWCASAASIWRLRRPKDFASLEEWVLSNATKV
ncbi:serine kinase [Salmonirosea aquatica]|uniref:Serine kinase n=1 Tax=Salmonirosea aquatica TaxID=2654236 RepID=A0A7C9F7I1_9BACT|nr:serine kinase [Cytophagaceae bacterium SJW1-29]